MGNSSEKEDQTQIGSAVSSDVPFGSMNLLDLAKEAKRQRLTAKNKTKIAVPNMTIDSKKGSIGETEAKKRKYFSRLPLQNLRSSFAGIHDTGWFPPDTMGAVGQNYVVNVTNGGFSVYNKAGTRFVSLTLDQFWQSFGINITNSFDPKILYDTTSRRFILVSVSGRSAPDSWLLVAASAVEDPFRWNGYVLNADVAAGSWADYPCLGVDSNNIYVSANIFAGNTFSASKVWVIAKQQIFTGQPRISWFFFFAPPGSLFTIQPTQVFDPALQTQYLISREGLASLRLFQITFQNGVPFWRWVGSIRINPFSSFSPPDAPQFNSSQMIDTGDTRLLQALYRNGHIWTTHTVPSADGRRAEAAWYQINPSQLAAIQQGRIGNSSRSYYYPSLAVNSRNDVIIGFSGSSPTEYASAFFTGRQAADPLGTVRGISLLRAGQATYFKPDNLGRNRWGDFSATCIDPTDDRIFWTFQEYAWRQNLWGTWWGAISF